jgi:hypothetical protein
MYLIGNVLKKTNTNIDGTSSNENSNKLSDEKSGLFIDSLRFRGKPMSLVNEYVNNEINGSVEIVEPRQHFAAFPHNNQSQIYPLQLEM